MLAGKLFHTGGPAVTKLHVPSTVLVLGSGGSLVVTAAAAAAAR